MAQKNTEDRPTNNVRIRAWEKIISIEHIRAQYPIGERANELLVQSRQEFIDILQGRDPRKVVLVGPCSIHDVEAAYEYGEKLLPLKKKYADKLLILMRVYFEKPRTSVGWKGLINDPALNGSYNINSGLKLARELLIGLLDMGIPAGTELLDPIVAAYISELVAWACIGARTTESQTHRQMASGLSAPVGFKNVTEGGIATSLHALHAASAPHSFLSVNDKGTASVIHTGGNPNTHIVLRGRRQNQKCFPNYFLKDIEATEEAMQAAGLTPSILVDCSHANSNYDHRKQSEVLATLIEEGSLKRPSLFGIMLESNLKAGNQKLGAGPLEYGQSITDKCIDIEETEALLEQMHAYHAQETALGL